MAFNLTTSQEALIYQCRITAVYPATMTADVYISEINSEYQGVYILTNNIQTTYGTASIPEVGSVGLIALYHKSKQPVLLGFIPPYKFNQGEQKFEYLKPGESQVSGKGGGFFRANSEGDVFIGTSSVIGSIYEKSGKVVDSLLEKCEISNFHRKDLRISNNNDIISMSSKLVAYTQIPIKKVAAKDVLKDSGLQEDVISSVMSDVDTVISKLTNIMLEINKIFAKVSDKTLTKSDVSDFEESMKAYQLPLAGTNIKCECLGNGGIKFGLYDDDTEISGIEINENGGKLTGKWE